MTSSIQLAHRQSIQLIATIKTPVHFSIFISIFTVPFKRHLHWSPNPFCVIPSVHPASHPSIFSPTGHLRLDRVTTDGVTTGSVTQFLLDHDSLLESIRNTVL